MSAAVEVTDLRFGYGDRPVVDVSRCELEQGASLAVIGPSGCGKTTFLHLLAGLLEPGSGSIRLMGQDLSELSGAALDRFRGRHIGLVFQQFHLMRALNVRANLQLAAKLARCKLESDELDGLCRRLGLDGLEHHKPSMLSQGQAQRVAIARALVHRPPIIMADEPTSSLDDNNAKQVIGLLKETAAAADAALLVVTHDQRVRGLLDTELELKAPA
ncbi:MAG: ATP-binding cassette domain-containing protein [Woeseiaceae bacterium]|nr:ATP-binding cassette domain-containing protein [Woeseiaceae bacterium]